MRLFIAREMLDPHLKIGGPVLNSHLPWSQRLRLLAKAARFYLMWYPKQWLPTASTLNLRPSTFNPHLRYAARTSRRLARAIFYAMIRTDKNWTVSNCSWAVSRHRRGIVRHHGDLPARRAVVAG